MAVGRPIGLATVDHVDAAADSTTLPADGLVGYWKLDEMLSTDPVIDSSPYRNDGTAVKGPLPSSSRPAVSFPDQASRSFNGTTQYIVIGNPEVLNFEGAITLAAWVSLAGFSDNCEVVVSHGFRFLPSQEVALRLGGGQCGSAQGPRAWAAGSYDGGADHFAGAPAIDQDIGTWIHLAGVYDGTAWRLYRNGQEIGKTDSSVGAIRIDADWAIGGKSPGEPNYPERFFHGLIDDVRIYDRALPPSEVLELYHR